MQKQRLKSTPHGSADDTQHLNFQAYNISDIQDAPDTTSSDIQFGGMTDGLSPEEVLAYEYSSESFRTKVFQKGSVLADTQSVSWLEGHRLAHNDQWVLEAHTIAWNGRFDDDHVHNTEHMGPMTVDEAVQTAFSYEHKRWFSDDYHDVPVSELSNQGSFHYIQDTPDLTAFATEHEIVLDETAIKGKETGFIIENMAQYKKLQEAIGALSEFDNRMKKNIVDRYRLADNGDACFYLSMASAFGFILPILPGEIVEEITNSNMLVLAAVMMTISLEAAGAAYGFRRHLYPERYVAGELDRKLNDLPGKELSGMARAFTKAARGVMHLELAAGNMKMYQESPNSVFANSRFKRGIKNIEKAVKADSSLDEASLKSQFIRGTFPEPGTFRVGFEQQRLALKQSLRQALGQDGDEQGIASSRDNSDLPVRPTYIPAYRY